MTAKKKQDDIHGRAILVNVKVRFWEARKHDKRVTEETNKRHHAEKGAGRYHKSLFGGKVPELQEFMSAYGRLRVEHREQTLPWSDEGWRILPTSNYWEYTKAIRERIAEFMEKKAEFLAVYPRLCKEAKERLGDMYDPSDYPAPSQVAGKYGVEVEYAPLPSGADFRVELPQSELKKAAKDVETRLARTVAAAMEDAWARLGDAATRLRSRLDGDAKGLRESAVENLVEIAEVLGRLNLTDDPRMDKIRQEVLDSFAGLDAETLRKDEKVRAAAQKKADDILKKMQSVYNPDQEAK